MKIYLMRHGKALSSQQDPQRGLSDHGKSEITHIAEHLNQQGLMFNHVFHSNRKRAQQTAEIMTYFISPNIEPALLQNITPNDDPGLILEKINSWTEDTLVTSHLPFVPDLITLLTKQDVYTSSISFKTGTVVCLEKDNNSIWNIRWSTSPDEL
jgi:phosphohistidine phosphatase